MTELERIIRELIAFAENGRFTDEPTGLSGGLNIKVKKRDELWVLAAWRVDAMPSAQELAVLVETVKRIHNPQLIFHNEAAVENGRVCGYRIYWSGVPMVVSFLRPAVQGRLFEGSGNNYGEG